MHQLYPQIQHHIFVQTKNIDNLSQDARNASNPQSPHKPKITAAGDDLYVISGSFTHEGAHQLKNRSDEPIHKSDHMVTTRLAFTISPDEPLYGLKSPDEGDRLRAYNFTERMHEQLRNDAHPLTGIEFDVLSWHIKSKDETKQFSIDVHRIDSPNVRQVFASLDDARTKLHAYANNAYKAIPTN